MQGQIETQKSYPLVYMHGIGTASYPRGSCPTGPRQGRPFAGPEIGGSLIYESTFSIPHLLAML